MPRSPSGPKIGFITGEAWASLSDEDQALCSYLKRHNVRAEPVVWTQRPPSELDFDLLVMRSAWDYQQRADEFRNWIRNCQKHGTYLLNAPDLLLWNIDKQYLFSVPVPVIPSVAVHASDDPVEAAAALLSDELVIKPSFSGGGHEVVRCKRENLLSCFSELVRRTNKFEFLVQEYFPEIQSQGEWSLVFFNGVYSHAVLKETSADDFRIQRRFGGRTSSSQPPEAIINQATHMLLTSISPVPLYARVDGIVREQQLYLSELELCEPYLFLLFAESAIQTFGDAILSEIRGDKDSPIQD